MRISYVDRKIVCRSYTLQYGKIKGQDINDNNIRKIGYHSYTLWYDKKGTYNNNIRKIGYYSYTLW